MTGKLAKYRKKKREQSKQTFTKKYSWSVGLSRCYTSRVFFTDGMSHVCIIKSSLIRRIQPTRSLLIIIRKNSYTDVWSSVRIQCAADCQQSSRIHTHTHTNAAMTEKKKKSMPTNNHLMNNRSSSSTHKHTIHNNYVPHYTLCIWYSS